MELTLEVVDCPIIFLDDYLRVGHFSTEFSILQHHLAVSLTLFFHFCVKSSSFSVDILLELVTQPLILVLEVLYLSQKLANFLHFVAPFSLQFLSPLIFSTFYLPP